MYHNTSCTAAKMVQYTLQNSGMEWSIEYLWDEQKRRFPETDHILNSIPELNVRRGVA